MAGDRRNVCRPWKELRHDNEQRFYIDGQEKGQPSHCTPSQKQKLVVYTEELTHF